MTIAEKYMWQLYEAYGGAIEAEYKLRSSGEATAPEIKHFKNKITALFTAAIKEATEEKNKLIEVKVTDYALPIDTIEKLEADLKEAVDALRPFAKKMQNFEDCPNVGKNYQDDFRFTFGQIETAHQIVSKHREDK